MTTPVFIVIKQAKKGPEIQGVFTTRVGAAQACRTRSDMVLMIPLDKELPRRRQSASGLWWHPKTNSVMVRGRWRKQVL